jgi:hypothetical protein
MCNKAGVRDCDLLSLLALSLDGNRKSVPWLPPRNERCYKTFDFDWLLGQEQKVCLPPRKETCKKALNLNLTTQDELHKQNGSTSQG